METVSPERIENTRKIGARIQSEVLQRLAEVTQERASACMGVSSSTVSRAKEDLDKVCQLVAALGFQLAPVDAVVVNQSDLQALKRMAFKYLQSEIESGA